MKTVSIEELCNKQGERDLIPREELALGTKAAHMLEHII